MSELRELAKQGQAVWLDYIQRSLITSGRLKELVGRGVRGVTSNPSIFQKAIAGNDDYDDDLKSLVRQGKSVIEIYEALVLDDIVRAADVLRSLFDETDGLDGYVSLEVNPNLANDTSGTIDEARRLFGTLKRPNVMIKVPATQEGIPAIETLIGEGINVNATLLFSLNHYEAVAGAYLAGLEKLSVAGGDLSRVASVASFFVSRVDTIVDQALEQIPEGADLIGKIALANSKIAYRRFQELFAGQRWDRLVEKGARVQRPLWASTGTKDPAYPDTLYVDSLIGPHTVNTIPPATLDAFLDHGVVDATLTAGMEQARSRLDRLRELGVDLDALTEKLQQDGVVAFARAFDGLLASISKKKEQDSGNQTVF
ncbi:MAG: transaldolase [Anaerolineales bacterium]|nr:transaldolase [Anaerolineales bacterium]